MWVFEDFFLLSNSVGAACPTCAWFKKFLTQIANPLLDIQMKGLKSHEESLEAIKDHLEP